MSGQKGSPSEVSPAETSAQEEMDVLYRKRRSGCLVRMIAVWLTMGVFLVLGVVFVRSNVERDGAVINGYVHSRFAFDLPARFEAYSMNHFFGTLAIAYWDREHMREDARTYNVVSFFQESDWRDQTANVVETGLQDGWDQKLRRNEFHTVSRRVEEVVTDAGTARIYIFEGKANIDEKPVDAVTCFRVVPSADGPMQLQTIGLLDTFPLTEQTAVLASVRALTPKD